jgi:hypothetical protein
MVRTIFTIFISILSFPLFAQLTFVTNPNAVGDNGQAVAGSLNDSWEAAQQAANCGTDPFIPIYGTMADDCAGGAPVGAGTITGLTQTDNLLYAGTVSFQERLIAEDDSDLATKGVPYTNACGATGGVRDDSNNTMQGNAPSADGVGMIDSDNDGNLDYYNGYASPPNGKKSAILITFSTPISHFGLFLGDFESRSDGLDGYPGQVVLFNGASIVTQSDIPTGTPNQAACDGDNNGSFDGCGNDETVWVEYTGASITDILIVVGEVSSDTSPNNNKGSFSGITLGGKCDITAPVELLSFSATEQAGKVRLAWATATEKDNAYFVVERSSDGTDFSEVGRVAGQGTTNVQQTYFFEDPRPESGMNYYRLRQTDLDGTSTLSPVRNVVIENPAAVVLFPNPTSGQLFIESTGSGSEPLLVRILNSLNQEVLVQTIYSGEAVDVSRLPTGMYMVYLNQDLRQPHRFVKR